MIKVLKAVSDIVEMLVSMDEKKIMRVHNIVYKMYIRK